MEGDFPSGAMVLVEYHRIKNSLHGARNKTKARPLRDMIDVMIDQLNRYVDEALECEPLVLATIMHPRYRLAFVQKAYPDHKDHTAALIHEAFASALETCQQQEAKSTQPPPAPNEIDDDMDDFDEFTASLHTNPAQSAREGELESYLMGHREFDKNKTALYWWKVSCFI